MTIHIHKKNDHPIESSINFDPFDEQMSYDDINIAATKNSLLKTIFSLNTNSQFTSVSKTTGKLLSFVLCTIFPEMYGRDFCIKNYPFNPICIEAS